MSYSVGSADSEAPAGLYPEPRDRPVRPRFRGLVVAGIALLVMGVFAGGLWFAYVQGTRHATASMAGDVPLIRADERPTKVKPEKPGGMEIPDRDKLIYTQKRAAVEHLLPPPEKPMPRPAGPAAQLEAPPASLPPTAATPAVAPATPAVAPPAAAKPPAKAGGNRLQLGSLRSEEAARQEWDRIKRANSDLLGSLSATPIRADLGEKGVFFRIQTGPVADAERVCRELRQRNLGCLIAR